MVIQIDAIDAIHILMTDILAHLRQDSQSQVAVIDIHYVII